MVRKPRAMQRHLRDLLNAGRLDTRLAYCN
jgi:hypothetical protein